MSATDPNTKALEFFKDWSNYLLVTTVAAVGWIAGKDSIAFSSAGPRAVCILALSLSIIFGVLTLALIPLVQEQRRVNASNYDVRVTYRMWSNTDDRRCTLKSLCFPQHVLFVLGIIAFALGTMFGDPDSMSKALKLILEIVVVVPLAAAALLIWWNWDAVGFPWEKV